MTEASASVGLLLAMALWYFIKLSFFVQKGQYSLLNTFIQWLHKYHGVKQKVVGLITSAKRKASLMLLYYEKDTFS